MVQTTSANHGQQFRSSRRWVLTTLIVALSYLFSSCIQNQAAFAAGATQPKKVSCIKSSKVVAHHKVCAVKLTSKTKKKAPVKKRAIAAAPTPNAKPPLDSPAHLNLSTPTNGPALLLKTDSMVCKLPSQNTRGDVEIGFPRIANRIASIGQIQSAMIFVDFSDAPATVSTKTLYSNFESAPAILKEFSYGRANLQMSTDLQWHRMSKTSTTYGQTLKSSFTGLRAYMSEAIAIASATQDFSKVNIVYVVSNPDAKSIASSMAFVAQPGYEIQTGATKISNGAVFGSGLQGVYAKTLVHETSHTFGLVDDYYANYTSSIPFDAFRFTGDFGIMGALYGSAPEYLAWESWLMGWLDDSQVNCLAPGTQTLTLQAIETPGGLKMALIPISRTKALVIESRRPLLGDANLPTSGVLVYTVDTSIASAEGPLRIIGGTLSHHLSDALLTNGEQITVGNATVRVTNSTKGSDTINVSVG